MPSGRGVQPVIADTNALVAVCKTGLDELVYRNVRMCTTNVCNEEIKRQRGMPDTSRVHENACERYLELMAQNRNPDSLWVEKYEPYVEDQGEDTIIDVVEAHHEQIKVVITFDFDAAERFDDLCERNGYAVDVRYPNFLFEKLREQRVISDDEYCEATYAMARAEGWTTKELLAELASTSGVDCPQL